MLITFLAAAAVAIVYATTFALLGKRLWCFSTSL